MQPKYTTSTNNILQPTPKRARQSRSCLQVHVRYESTVQRTVWLYRIVFSTQTRVLLWCLLCAVLIPPLPALAEAEAIDSVVQLDSTPLDYQPAPQPPALPPVDPTLTESESNVRAEMVQEALLEPEENSPSSETDEEGSFTLTPPIDLHSLQSTNTSQIGSGTTTTNDLDDVVATTATTTVVDALVASTSSQQNNDENQVVPSSDEADTEAAESAVRLVDSNTSSRASPENDTVDDQPPDVAAPFGPVSTPLSFVESDSHVTFSRDDCVVIENGSFYCQKTTDEVIPADGLFSAPDESGTLEIFLVRNGERHQITSNNYDDASPFYDQYSNTIVWHRLIDDRYQIISYDVARGEETQLTHTSVNNMEPSRHGRFTVWQRWIENNWEIILHDGVEERRLTNSIEHDIAPRIRGSLVIWNTRTAHGTHELQTYDIAQQTFTRINDSSGLSVRNPRMVVLFDEIHQNGDIITRGFDLLTGEVVPLSAIPRDLPDRIPVSDSTGETRALIQVNPTVPKSDSDSDDDADDVSTIVIGDELETLDLRSATTTETATTTPAEVEFELDLSTSTATTSATEKIDGLPEIVDVVIPPFEESTASSTHG